ncbi:uncharacterized protein LOC122046173 isoform X3 [Zingiber officinale]|uniref:uncharacterized protein LOC122046173 isoform X3 n=1 Tax=Zingiber officinale TaxID=94328 RepID=UPI001C4C109C|nr:uncharacterized protein LOC122046173 isoform X3 [Zingiber officinale]XP_042462668.1 uncharacterized protein LOC122046173 isoform X3 [Zingiber officinale]
MLFLDEDKLLWKMQVIALTEELLTTAKPTDACQHDTDASFSGHFGGTSHSKASFEHSQPHESFTVGTKVQAVWSEDGEWYNAIIDAITPNGYYVSYDGWGNKEEVDPANVRPVEEGDALLEAEREAEATKQAIKRKIAQAAITDYQARTLPAKLRIDPNDPEDIVSYLLIVILWKLEPSNLIGLIPKILKLRNARKYMHSSQRFEVNSLKLHKISGRTHGSNSNPPKGRPRRLDSSRVGSEKVYSSPPMILVVRLVLLAVERD